MKLRPKRLPPPTAAKPTSSQKTSVHDDAPIAPSSSSSIIKTNSLVSPSAPPASASTPISAEKLSPMSDISDASSSMGAGDAAGKRRSFTKLMKPRSKAGGNAGSADGGQEMRSPLDDIAMPGIIAHRLSDFGGGVSNHSPHSAGSAATTPSSRPASRPESVSAPLPPKSLGGVPTAPSTSPVETPTSFPLASPTQELSSPDLGELPPAPPLPGAGGGGGDAGADGDGGLLSPSYLEAHSILKNKVVGVESQSICSFREEGGANGKIFHLWQSIIHYT